jgi:tetratricopeptide (TPR) repeat protein
MADLSGQDGMRELKSAVEFIQRGEFGKAEKILLQITTREPNNLNANHMLGIVSTELNKFEQAEKFFKTSLSIDARYPPLYKDYGTFLTRTKQFDRAIEQFNIALRLFPNFAPVYSDRGNALEKLDKLDEAIADYNRAIALAPRIFGFYNNRGNAFLRKKQFSEALSDFKRAIELNPNFAGAYCGQGNVLADLKRHEEALTAYDKALSLKPDLENAWLGRGNVFVGLKRHDDAFAAYDKALALEPACAQAHYSEGLLRLALGEMESGWKKCEYRWETQQFRARKRNFLQPLWLGDSDLKDKTILLHADQGLGDTLLACRYLPNFAPLAAKVILEVQPPLKSLLRGFQGVSTLIGRGEAIPGFDVHCPLMSLPLAFKTTIETIPSTVPYVTVPKNAIERWRPKLSTQKLKVGIAWAGNPNFDGDRDRSILLKNILPVTQIDGIRYFSLQKDLRDGDDELLDANPCIVRTDKEINDFEDTAAIIMSLDLVISSDTSVVNLAGALGRPVWVLLPFRSDWRWLLDRDDTPWYRTARLFRQANVGDWTAVLDDVRVALRELLDHRSSSVRAPV